MTPADAAHKLDEAIKRATDDKAVAEAVRAAVADGVRPDDAEHIAREVRRGIDPGIGLSAPGYHARRPSAPRTAAYAAADDAMPDAAAAMVDSMLDPKPDLVVHGGDLPATADALRDVLAKSDQLFDRGVPVRVAVPADGGPPIASRLTKHGVVREAHRLSRPVKMQDEGESKPVTLPERLALMYLDMLGDWSPLAGVSTAPLLSNDGNVRTAHGYDVETELWCAGIPTLPLPARPSRADAELALRKLRGAFRTFPFADAERQKDTRLAVELVRLDCLPGLDESAFLVALLTAVCRPSLWLAPGLLATAPAVSGAGSGKGLLVRAICAIAYGIRPRAFTAGADRAELDKRLAAELIEAQPALFLDNVNGVALRSDILASVLTERPARVRLLGETRMMPLNNTAFIAVTGNGLAVTEDLARRFITCSLDARCEDPESRPFPAGFIDEIEARRAELLGAALTIWRWGRQNELAPGRPLGSFERWCAWCRDPLLALGCADPVERIEAIKAADPQRQRIAEIFGAWWKNHGAAPVTASHLAESVQRAIDPQGRGRQYIATRLANLAGTRAAGYVLTRQPAAGKWTASTYALAETAAADLIGHRTHRTHPAADAALADPMGPMSPMPDAVDGMQKWEIDL